MSYVVLVGKDMRKYCMWAVNKTTVTIIFLLSTLFAINVGCRTRSVTVDWSLYDKEGVIRYDLYYSYNPNMEPKILACSTDNPLIETITCNDIDVKDITYFMLTAVKKDIAISSNIKAFDSPVKIVLHFINIPK